MNGGKFQGSNVADFSSGVVDLYTIPSIPSRGWNEVTVSNATPFRYVRYLSPTDGFCNVAEIEICGIDNVSPTVTITSPANGATYIAPATINIAADVTGSINKVEFYIGASLIGTSTASPYNYNWTGVGAGTYNLIAKAYDNTGMVISSAPVNFTVKNNNNIAPTVSITAPTNNAIYLAPATFDISATANDADGNIDKVEFYNGATLLGTVTASPYTFNWSNVAAGAYTLTAKAYDNDGAVTTSSAVSIRVNQPPTVSITAPVDNAIYAAPATIAISATANDTEGNIDKVEFYNGTTLLGTVTASPYTFNWSSVAAGTYTLTAKAYDKDGAATTSSAVSVRVNQPPTVSITAPANNAVYIAPATFDISATANDSDGTISKVEFYNGSTILGTVNTSPYTFNWNNVSAGTYTLTAKAYDNNGVATTSSPIEIRVNTLVNQSPSVSITSPANNAVFIDPATITINADATDPDGTISKVEFYNGATLLSTSTTSPYTYTWNNVVAGTYAITAKSYDNANAEATSSVVNVIVNNNQPPSASITSPANNTVFIAPASITIDALAEDSDGTISKVEFYNGTTLLSTSIGPRYTYIWDNVVAGTYALTVKSYDNANAVTTSSVVNVVVNNSNNNQFPMVSITSPANNTVFISPATITINAVAADSDGTISKVEFYNGTTLLSTSTTSPYTYTWNNVVAGTYAITAKAYDDANATATSSVVNVIVNNNQPPSASIISPANNTVFIAPASITIDALAEDSDGTISKVEFYNGTTLLSTSTTSPYTYTWNNVVAGTYAITVKSYDDLNATATSSVVNVVVNNNQAPSVSITSPANNAVFIAPASITINADATDPDGTISKVEFYNGTTLLSTSTSSPYTYTWDNVAAGTYTLTAKAYDNNDVATTSSAVSVRVNQPPTVSITAPANNAVYIAPATFDISATANDSDGTISKVEFYNGSTILGTVNTSPYTFNWNNVSAGTYTLTAKAYDNNGVATTSSPIEIRVNTLVNQSPTASITSPATNTTFIAPASITINAVATDSDGTISKVEFYNGTTLLSTSTTSPYTYIWNNVAAGTYALTVKSYDNLNATATSSVVNIVVNNNQSPTASITSPANNTTFISPASITINAAATDSDGTISKVEFYNGTTLLSTSTSSPYTYIWNNVATGTYALTVKSYDNLNATATSSVVNVVVNNNQAPTASITSPATNTTFIAPASITINAAATDSDGTISKVEFYNGATLLSTSTTSPYTYIWNNVVAGTYALTVKSYDNANATVTSSVVNVVVNNNQSPTVRVTSPANNTAFMAPASITINAVAADSDGTISKVEFYNGATLLSTSTSSPYTYTWNNVEAGTYQIVAKATDNTGNVTSSTPVTILVKATPIVSMTSPSVNDQVVDSGSDILFNFNVSDPDRVLKSIIIKDNGVIISTINKSPYSFTLTNMSFGDNHFTATAVLEDGTEYTFANLNIVGRNCKSAVWNASTDYLVGDQVIYQNIIYRALAINKNKQPDLDSSVWSKIGTCENQGLEYSWARLYTLYPNPCTTYFNIKFFDCAGKSFYYRIVDMSGRLIRDKSSETIKDAIFEKEVKIQGLSSGTYIVYIHIDEKVFSEKIIVVEKPSNYKKKR